MEECSEDDVERNNKVSSVFFFRCNIMGSMSREIYQNMKHVSYGMFYRSSVMCGVVLLMERLAVMNISNSVDDSGYLIISFEEYA